MPAKKDRTTCSHCGRNVGLMQQPRLPGAMASYRVAFHRYQDKTCLGVGEPRPAPEGKMTA